jgi:hypothetical protein
LDRAVGLLRYDEGPHYDPSAAYHLADFDLHDVTAAQLSIDRKIEQNPVQ